jgi:hypothetical protein
VGWLPELAEMRLVVTINTLCLTSLVAAVPGAWLAVLMVMAFVNHAGGWSVTLQGLAGILLLIGSTLALMPVGIYVLMGPKAEKASKKKKDSHAKEADSAAEPSESTEALMVDDADAFDADAIDEADATFEADIDHRDSEEFVETMSTPDAEADSDAFDLGDDFELDSQEDAEAKPKKKK